MTWIRGGFAAAAVLLWLESASALTPTVGYSGRLFDATNTPVNGNVDMAFRLFDGEDIGAALLFEETFSGADGVSVNNGYFWVLLGNNEANAMTLDEVAALYDGLYLEVVVNGSPLEPRQPLAPVPWALASSLATGTEGGGGGSDKDTLGGLACADGQIPKRVAGVWACSADDGGAGGNALEALGCADGQIATRAGGVWQCGVDADTAAGWTTCSPGEVMKWNGASWACATDAAGGAPNWPDLLNIPAGLVDIGADPAVACFADSVVVWNGSAWTCSASTSVTASDVRPGTFGGVSETGDYAFPASLTVGDDINLGGTIDGVDLSAHAANANAHHTPPTVSSWADGDAMVTCSSNQKLDWNGTSWTCESYTDNTGAISSCAWTSPVYGTVPANSWVEVTATCAAGMVPVTPICRGGNANLVPITNWYINNTPGGYTLTCVFKNMSGSDIGNNSTRALCCSGVPAP